MKIQKLLLRVNCRSRPALGILQDGIAATAKTLVCPIPGCWWPIHKGQQISVGKVPGSGLACCGGFLADWSQWLCESTGGGATRSSAESRVAGRDPLCVLRWRVSMRLICWRAALHCTRL